MRVEVNLPDVTTDNPQVQPSLWGSISKRCDLTSDSQQRLAGFLVSPACSRDCLSCRYFQQPFCCFPAASLCLGLSGLDSLTNDPSCHQSQYQMHPDNTGNSLLCEDRHLRRFCETILAKEDRQLYFVPNIVWQVWTHPGITLLSSWLEGQGVCIWQRESSLAFWQKNENTAAPRKKTTNPFVNQVCQI